MDNKTIQFVFNQTYYYRGNKYQSGDVIDILEKEKPEWDKVSFGNVYKPKGKKDK